MGLYPQYQQNATTHEWYPVNGGLPQLVNMTAHLAAWASDVQSLIPDPDAAPIVGLDMEAWRVAWSGNDPRPMAEPAQAVVQNESIALVRRQHPDWPAAQVLAEAKRQWSAGAKAFWSETFALAKKLRPNAQFGNYDFNHCGNWGCADSNYWGWLKQCVKPLPARLLPGSLKARCCPQRAERGRSAENRPASGAAGAVLPRPQRQRRARLAVEHARRAGAHHL